ncbi:MAG TPA: Mur ligase family protein, partial [Candidatus Gracilibacteria bacterium]
MESFQQAQDWLETLEPKWGVLSGKQKLSLEVVRELLSLLGDPDKFFKYRVIVGGTAGKGTVARKLCATLHEAGVKVGCLTSPHLQTPLERIKIGDHLVDPALFGRCLLEIKAVSQDLVPTQYEAILLAGVLCCQKEACEVLIAEVGLGGEFDGVNALRGPRIAAVTFIGDDHRDILGDFPQMARTKAKIFNEDSRLNLSYEKVYKDIFNQTAVGSVEYIKGVPTNLSSKLVKRIAREILGAERSFEVVHVKLPARWEKIPEDKYQNAYLTAGPSTLILDGSHSR